jgi:DNA-binding CsgD family transcriptional regulator
LSVLVAPVRTEVAWMAAHRPAAILFVTDPDRQRAFQIGVVGRRFGLTPAEIRFVSQIIKGDGLSEAAKRLGISLATARTHMRHVSEKTGVKRQAELVSLLAMHSSALRED